MDKITIENLDIQNGDMVLMVHAGNIPIASLYEAQKIIRAFCSEYKKAVLLLMFSERDFIRKDTLQTSGHDVIFSSGKVEHLNEGIIGISEDSKAITDASGPFPDGRIKLTNDELIELSTHMICRWLEVIRRAQEENE